MYIYLYLRQVKEIATPYIVDQEKNASENLTNSFDRPKIFQYLS